jgi:hypothetical protein
MTTLPTASVAVLSAAATNPRLPEGKHEGQFTLAFCCLGAASRPFVYSNKGVALVSCPGGSWHLAADFWGQQAQSKQHTGP